MATKKVVKKVRRKRFEKKVHLPIGGELYTIYYCTAQQCKDLKGNHGMCDTTDKIIWIRSTDGPETQKMTLFHELCHCVADEVSSRNGLQSEKFTRPFSLLLRRALLDAGFTV